MKKEKWQTIGIIGITVVIAIAMVWINTYHRSVKYHEEGESLLSEGKLLEAVTSFETAAHAFTPWNSHVRDSLTKLWEIGQRFEEENPSPEYALIAYRSLRSSVYAVRSFYMPYKEWIPRCDERIQALVTVQKARIEAERMQSKTNATDTPADNGESSTPLTH